MATISKPDKQAQIADAIGEAQYVKSRLERLEGLLIVKDVDWHIESHFRDAANSLQLGILALEAEKKKPHA